MLLSLKINDVAIIEEASLRLFPGLNIMTGETGSGKSIVIDSIGAILGERTNKELIRDGAQAAKVTAVFDDIGEKAKAVLEKYGIDHDDDSVMLQRVIKEGRSICKINGETVTTAVLREIGQYLVNIHGQNDSRALLDSENHILYVDSFAENSEILFDYKKKYASLRDINRELKRLNCDEAEKERRMEMLEFQIREIQNADIHPGERDELLKLKKRIQNMEKIKRCLLSSYGILNGDDENSGLISMLYSLSDSIEELCDSYREALPFSEGISSFIDTMKDYSSFLSTELNLTDESADINAVEERLDLLYRLSKKYGATEEDILSFLEKAEKEYGELSVNGERTQELTLKYNAVLEELLEKGRLLTRSRLKAGEELARKIMSELEFLDMPGTEFKVSITQGPVTSTGRDIIEFLISPNKGQSLKPLSKIASGGELSRVMLAIKTALNGIESEGQALIFDEIDTGVSGRAAEKIGIKLRELSEKNQVICVTHSAQIAGFADNHLFIEKITENDRTLTKIRQLDFEERKREIARIMGGTLITANTLKSAEEMLRNH